MTSYRSEAKVTDLKSCYQRLKMWAQIEIWEKDKISPRLLLPNHYRFHRIKATEIVRQAVNEPLDGTIEKQVYLAKKDELIKQKLDFKTEENWILGKGE